MRYLLLISILFLFSCDREISEYDKLHKSNPIGSYGEKINSDDFIIIKELISNGDDNLNKEVLVSGLIQDVCPMRGCWIKIKDYQTDFTIRVKVIDGDIVFPLSSIGKNVNVKGIFTKLEFSEKQAKMWKMHLAEEKGIQLLEDEVIILPEDLIEYRINGVGARIFE